MVNDRIYLKQDTLVEPLFNRWYAWPYLIPPASAAMFITNAHLKVMKSFVSAPQVHRAALRNPAMMGGPFLNCDSSSVGEVEQLIEETAAKSRNLIDFAEAINRLDAMLAADAKGSSVEALYERIPDILRGYVELVYDLQDRPSIRFMEGLLYRSKYYDPAAQSIVLSQAESDGRSFAFSTPRLKSDGRLYLDVPFNHEGIDELFKMQNVPRSYGYIKELLRVDGADDRRMLDLFSTREPIRRLKYAGEGCRIRYFGHACLLIESSKVSVLCDPLISTECPGGIDRFTYEDLPETIDYVLITHTHQDHLMFESLLRLRHRIRNLIVPKSSGGDRMDPSLKLLLRTIGFENVYELDEMESIRVADGTIIGLPFLGEHADLNIRTKLAYYINLKGTALLMAADSNNLEPRLYQHIHEVVGTVNMLFLGMECDGAPMSWLYGPLRSAPISRANDQSRRLNGSTSRKGLVMVDLLKPAEVYVYAMGQEPWCTFLTSIQYTPESRPIVESDELVAQCRKRGLVSERLYGKKEMFRPPN